MNLADRASFGSVLGAAGEVGVVADLADLEDDKVLGREHVVEIVRVDLEQDRGHSTRMRRNIITQVFQIQIPVTPHCLRAA